MAKNPIIAIIRQLTSGVDNDQLAAYARPHDPADYEIPELDGSGSKAAEIPLDCTADDASWSDWPERTLDGCREPLADGVALVGVGRQAAQRAQLAQLLGGQGLRL